MSDPFDFADELGPDKIVHLHEARHALRAIVVVDNVARGPSIGGVRMAPDVSLDECFRLARAMTLKNAAAGLPHGGGKAVIFGDPSMDGAAKERLMRAFARAIVDLGGYIPGPDMGTDERCMAWMKDEIGRAVGLPPEVGGIPLDEIGATGFGLAAAVEVARRRLEMPLEGARVVVQGFGSVGRHAARFLCEGGAVLVAASDSAGAVYDPQGLDVEALVHLKAGGGRLTDHPQGRRLDRDAVLGIPCEIWIPAARPDVVHEENQHLLDTRLVVQGANIPFTEGAERALHARGVLTVPDFIANAGGVICAAVEYHGGTRGQAFDTIRERITENVEEVLAQAARDDVPPREAAVALARERVRRAMALRR
jgi:glutamate dehydrogenase/leucine dehydrogenase